MGKIILASASPRRRQILKKAGLCFEIVPSPYVEEHSTTVFSYEFVEGLAKSKALALLPFVKDEAKIIGADTIVVLDKEILGKPANEDEAFNMLKQLSGKTHFVVTSVAVVNTKTGKVKLESTTSYVEFEKLSDKKIRDYVERFCPLDKAGAYGIQEMPQGYIKSYTGSLENIIGIDSKVVKKLLR